MLAYSDAQSGGEVAALIEGASLTPEQTKQVLAALDTALSDAFYTILLALDGAGSLGSRQQAYTIRDDRGNMVSSGDGRLEAAAWEALQSRRK